MPSHLDAAPEERGLLPADSEEVRQDGGLDLGYQDAALPFENDAVRDRPAAKPRPWKTFVPRRRLWVTSILVLFGFFLAVLSAPRKKMDQDIRLFLITLDASLVTLPITRIWSFSSEERVRRLATAYLGFYLSMFAMFGASDEVHIDMQWRSLLWYQVYDGFRLGYALRLVLAIAGFYIQRRAGLYSAKRILETYILATVWIYTDLVTTISGLARGRQRW